MPKKIHYEIWLAVLIVPLFFVITLTGCFNQKKTTKQQQTDGPQEIVIGYVGNLSKAGTNYFGISGKMGAELAVEDINAQGGIMGKKIRLVVVDDQADKELSKEHVERLINENKALAIIGPTDTANFLNWMEIAQNSKTPVFINVAAAGGLTEKFADRPRNYIFRVAASDTNNVRAYVAYAIKESNNGKIAVIYDSTAYGQQGLKYVSEALSRWGKVPSYIKAFGRDASREELVEIMKGARDAGAHAIIFHALGDSTVNLVKALREVSGYDPVLVGTNALGAASFWDLGGELISDVVYPMPEAARDYVEGREVPLNAKLDAKYKKVPVYTTAYYGYDIVYLIKAGIEKANSLDKTAIRDAMEEIKQVRGVSKIFINPFSKNNHEAFTVRDIYLARWIDGKQTEIDVSVQDLEIK